MNLYSECAANPANDTEAYKITGIISFSTPESRDNYRIDNTKYLSIQDVIDRTNITEYEVGILKELIKSRLKSQTMKEINGVQLTVVEAPENSAQVDLCDNELHAYLVDTCYDSSGLPYHDVSDGYIELPKLPSGQRYKLLPTEPELYVKEIYTDALPIHYREPVEHLDYCFIIVGGNNQCAISEQVWTESDAWQSAQQIILTELGATTNVVILKTIKN